MALPARTRKHLNNKTTWTIVGSAASPYFYSATANSPIPIYAEFLEVCSHIPPTHWVQTDLFEPMEDAR